MPSVICVGVTVNETPPQVIAVIAVTVAIGLMVTVNVKGAPTYPPEEVGITV